MNRSRGDSEEASGREPEAPFDAITDGGVDLEDPSAWFCSACDERFPKAGKDPGQALTEARRHVREHEEEAEPRFDPGPRDEEIVTDGGTRLSDRQEVEATLRIPLEGDSRGVWEAEEKLLEAGVHFDTGTDLEGETNVREWHLDFSLEGATLYRGPRATTDGGVVEYECMNCGRVNNCRVDGDGVRRCNACGRAVRPLATDGGQVIPPEVDAEELHRRKRSLKSTTPIEERNRCPECGTLDVVNIVGRRDVDYDYRCNNRECQARLDEGDLVTGEPDA